MNISNLDARFVFETLDLDPDQELGEELVHQLRTLGLCPITSPKKPPGKSTRSYNRGSSDSPALTDTCTGTRDGALGVFESFPINSNPHRPRRSSTTKTINQKLTQSPESAVTGTSPRKVTEFSTASSLYVNTWTISKLYRVATSYFDLIPAISPVLELSYVHQASGELMGTVEFEYSDEDLDTVLSTASILFAGNREAVGVAVDEAYKCRNCDYAEQCRWRIARANGLVN